MEKVQKFIKKSKFTNSRCVKMADFELIESSKLIPCKILSGRKIMPEISTL